MGKHSSHSPKRKGAAFSRVASPRWRRPESVLFSVVALAALVLAISLWSSPRISSPGAPTGDGPLSVRVHTDKETYALGEPVQIVLYVKNLGESQIEFVGFAAGFEVFDSRGASIYGSLVHYVLAHDRPMTLKVGVETPLKDGFEWEQNALAIQDGSASQYDVPPGMYNIKGIFRSPQGEATNQLSIEVRN